MRAFSFVFIQILTAWAFVSSDVSAACPSYAESRELLRQGKQLDAERSVLCQLKLAPNDRDSLRLLADIFRAEGRTSDANKILGQVYELALMNPEDFDLAVYAKRRLSRMGVTATYQSVWSTHDLRGDEFNFEGSVRYLDRQNLRVGFDRITKAFQDGTDRSDAILRLENTFVSRGPFYFDATAAYSPSAHFSPNWKFGLEPHFVFSNEMDIALGNRLSLYENTTTFLLRPGLSMPLTDWLLLGLNSDIELRPERAMAGGGWLEFKFLPRLLWRASVSGGKTDDGDGILDTFTNYGLSARIRLLTSLDVSLFGSVYRGKNRDENRLGSGLNWIF